MTNIKDIFKKGKGYVKALPSEKKEVNPIPKGKHYIEKLILTGNIAVDRVQQAIKYHQDRGIRLRSIALTPRLYSLFYDWMQRDFIKQTKGKAELSPETELVLYDVTIKKGSALQAQDLYFEDYFSHIGQTDATFDGNIRKAFSGMQITGPTGKA